MVEIGKQRDTSMILTFKDLKTKAVRNDMRTYNKYKTSYQSDREEQKLVVLRQKLAYDREKYLENNNNIKTNSNR